MLRRKLFVLDKLAARVESNCGAVGDIKRMVWNQVVRLIFKMTGKKKRRELPRRRILRGSFDNFSNPIEPVAML